MVDETEEKPKKKWKRRTPGSGYGRKLTPEQREKAIKNLKPAEPGNNRNPKGRPVGSPSMTACLRAAVEETITFPDPLYVPKKLKKGEKPEAVPMVTMKIKDLINRALLRNAVMGELPSTESIYRKLDGSPDQITNVNLAGKTREVLSQLDDDISELLDEDE